MSTSGRLPGLAADLRARALIWILAGAAGLVGALVLAGRVACSDASCPAPELDRALLQAFHHARTPVGEAVMTAVTWLGSMLVLLPTAVLLSFWTPRRGTRAFFLPLALVGGWLLLHAAKWLVDRPRPNLFPSLVQMPTDASFPSGHAAQTTIFVVAWLATRRPEPAWGYWLAGAAFVALVALSRIYLQVHFPTDVIAGLLFGLAWVALLHHHWPGGPR